MILTSSSKYDLSQLPEDKAKDLIFYCSNTRCTASDAAAERAAKVLESLPNHALARDILAKAKALRNEQAETSPTQRAGK